MFFLFRYSVLLYFDLDFLENMGNSVRCQAGLIGEGKWTWLLGFSVNII